ncbi:Sterol regulatory element-binding protein ECM22-like protein 1 [Colletotrichum chlorophyti]|uniref:Sterol regulatory element-binding protein ECM22-like protein 1 n=1 Tax=Colletotrichum chlorophyti TaxID=708187 RepID=A0A1Q8S451_9PEZI|nr:Sterol regulatory element-binding protein ECM22-like protein 1 [Colletotrichum chlorophyti]
MNDDKENPGSSTCTGPANDAHSGTGCCCGTCRKHKRRSHKKSRNGCQNCKRRKCDETKPECGNCVRFSMHCDFAPAPTNLLAQAPTAPASVPKKRGRPRKDWDAFPKLPTPTPTASEADTAKTPQTPQTPLPAPNGPPFSAVLNADDLELLHHYMCHTAITLGEARVWREHVPRLGFHHHYVLHMVLAISAQHLARLRPSKAAHYEALADRHSTSALPAVTNFISQLNNDNCQALYHTTVLVCLSTFAKKPSPGHLLVIAENGEVPWWGLMRGVRIVVKRMGIQAIIAGWADDGVSFEQTWTHCPPLPAPIQKMVHWEKRFDELSDLVATTSEPERAMYTASLESLKDCFKMTYGTEAEPEPHIQGKFEVVMRWLYNMSDEFVLRLERRQPLALILLGHFSVLIQTLEHFWFMQGWSKHLANGMFRTLDPQHAHWLQWPTEQINHPGPVDHGVLSVQKMID